ncbi:MAG: HAD-IIIA family hydrolase [Gemmatimonadaceae bacterium]
MMPLPAVLLEKDGALVEIVPNSADPLQMQFTLGAASALRLWHSSGYRIAVVSYQPGVALGACEESVLVDVEDRLREMMGTLGVPLAGFFYCPHPPDGIVAPFAKPCDCRKPEPGLIQYAAESLGIDTQRCWVIGDVLDDVEAGGRAGCTTVLLDNGGETEWRLTPWRIPDYLAHDLLEAAEVVVAAAEAALTVRASAGRMASVSDSTAPSEW